MSEDSEHKPECLGKKNSVAHHHRFSLKEEIKYMSLKTFHNSFCHVICQCHVSLSWILTLYPLDLVIWCFLWQQLPFTDYIKHLENVNMQVLTQQMSVYATYNCFLNTCERLVITERGERMERWGKNFMQKKSTSIHLANIMVEHTINIFLFP